MDISRITTTSPQQGEAGSMRTTRTVTTGALVTSRRGRAGNGEAGAVKLNIVGVVQITGAAEVRSCMHTPKNAVNPLENHILGVFQKFTPR